MGNEWSFTPDKSGELLLISDFRGMLFLKIFKDKILKSSTWQTFQLDYTIMSLQLKQVLSSKLITFAEQFKTTCQFQIFFFWSYWTIYLKNSKFQDTTKPSMGKMNAAQMIAHCCVTYELVYRKYSPQAWFVDATLLKTIVKKRLQNNALHKKP